MSATGIFWIAAGIIVALLALTELVAWVAGAKKSFLATVIVGQDGRTSTSKTFILLWTLLVGWALISLLIAGEFADPEACAKGMRAMAITTCEAEHNEVGVLQLGWMNFLHAGLLGSYLVLLGIPAAAGVTAKGIVESRNQNGTITKTQATKAEEKLGPRVAQIFSADDGTTDIGDFQYLVFNIITAAYFVVNFVKPEAHGLPSIPDTLLGLTGVSAALYVGKKAVTRNTPVVTGVFPSLLLPKQPLTVVGAGLSDPSEEGPNPPKISINGKEAVNVKPDPAVPDRLTAEAPANMVPPGAPAGQPQAGQLEVLTSWSIATKPFSVTCL